MYNLNQFYPGVVNLVSVDREGWSLAENHRSATGLKSPGQNAEEILMRVERHGKARYSYDESARILGEARWYRAR